MEVLKQLEFMKKKIDSVNQGLRTNLEMRKTQKIQIKAMQNRLKESYNELNEIPQPELTQEELNLRAQEIIGQIVKVKTQKIVRERTLSLQVGDNDRLIKEYRKGIKEAQLGQGAE